MNSSLCSSIDAQNSARPDLNFTLNSASLAILVVECFCILLSTPFIFWLKDEPMFYKIRPPVQMVLNNALIGFTLIGYVVPQMVRTFPCSLELIIHVLGAAVVVPTFSQRAMLFIVESEHTKRIQKVVTFPQPETKPITMVSTILLFLKVGLRIRLFETLDTSELISLRRYKNAIFLFIMIPPLLTLVLSLALMPIFSCVECFLSWEFILIVFGPTSLGVIINYSVIWIALFSEYSDPQYVRRELLCMLMFAGTFIYAGYILEFLDPGMVQYTRMFSWRLILSLGPFSFWVTSCAAPIVTAMIYVRARKRVAIIDRMCAYNGKIDFYDFVQSDPPLAARFHLFAGQRLCIENLNFMRDVTKYQALEFSFRSDKSRMDMIMKTYIIPGSEQEVNISSKARSFLLQVDFEKCSVIQLNTVFHSAYEEVKNMVISGTWTDFIMEEKKRHKSMINKT